MSSHLAKMANLGFISPPEWLPANVMYEGLTGSVAYGCSSDTSDMDVVGFCFPPKELIFPHLAGDIPGFGRQKKRFDQFQQHHVKWESGRKEYDFTIYSIVKFFQLCMDNNPNMLDVLFLPADCVLKSSKVAELVRANKTRFLHKGSYHKFKGYAYAQLHKMDNKNPVGKRKELVERFGFDTKFACHLVRLAYECQQILEERTLDLRRNREHLKAIRRGDIPEQEIRDWFTNHEKILDDLYHTSSIPHSPDEAELKELLLNCIEEQYGSLTHAIVIEDDNLAVLRQIKDLVKDV